MSFLEAKCRELGAHEVEADVALRERFVDLARALGRESHWRRVARFSTGPRRSRRADARPRIGGVRAFLAGIDFNGSGTDHT